MRLATRLSDSHPVVAKFIHSSNVWDWDQNDPNHKLPSEISMMKMFSDLKLGNVIEYYTHFEVGERYIIVMEYLGQDWIDLYDFIEFFGPVTEKTTTTIFKSICKTIETMHSMGYSHNDIKGSNQSLTR